jgi:hypothetical protein
MATSLSGYFDDMVEYFILLMSNEFVRKSQTILSWHGWNKFLNDFSCSFYGSLVHQITILE